MKLRLTTDRVMREVGPVECLRRVVVGAGVDEAEFWEMLNERTTAVRKRRLN